MTTTKFRCLRRFRAWGVDYAEGQVVELTDDQARELIWMPGTIEPADKADCRRVVPACPGVTWGAPEAVPTGAVVLPWMSRRPP